MRQRCVAAAALLFGVVTILMFCLLVAFFTQ